MDIAASPVVLRAAAEWTLAANAQIQPAAASLSFLTRRCVMQVDFPDAWVTNADPVYALTARASVKRSRSSPSSARTRAPRCRRGQAFMDGACWKRSLLQSS